MRIDQSSLFHSLLSSLDKEDFLALCRELKVDGIKLGFQDDSLQLEALIALMAQLSREDRISEFLDSANRIRPGVIKIQDEKKKRIIAEWEPQTLSKRLVQKLNAELEQEGIPYVVCRSWLPDEAGKPRETGCFCWHFEFSEEDMREFLTMEDAQKFHLERVRQMLTDEIAIAYVGEHCYGFDSQGLGICIVVAPTTDSLDPIRIEQTRNDNYEITPEDLIERLTEIDEKYGLDIVAADFGSVTFRIKRIPQGQERIDFGYWLHDFAPDAYEVDDVMNYDIFTEGIRLIWD